jgi:hypothetical protein
MLLNLPSKTLFRYQYHIFNLLESLRRNDNSKIFAMHAGPGKDGAGHGAGDHPGVHEATIEVGAR